MALYGTGASPSLLEKAYDLRDPLQRPVEPRHDAVVRDLLASWDNAIHYLGNEEHYPDFLAYFQKRIDAQGYESVVQEHLLKGDAHADDRLTRLHAGVVHPLIQLMYGLEWKQPAIVAEALAQTRVHHIEGLDELLLVSERRAYASTQISKMPSLVSIYESLHADPTSRPRLGSKTRIKFRMASFSGPMIRCLPCSRACELIPMKSTKERQK